MKITRLQKTDMNKITLGIAAAVIFLTGIILGATITNALTSSFKIKENKIFFNLVEVPSEEAISFTLPSTVGRNGHVYIVKRDSASIGHLAIDPSPGDTIDPDAPSIPINTTLSSYIFVADEANRTWWAVSSL